MRADPNKFKRRGNIVVLSAGVLVMLLAFAAFTVDIGYLALVKAQLQNAVASATLAAAMELNPNGDQSVVEANVKQAVQDLASLNPVDGNPGLLVDSDTDIELGRRDWDPVNETFVFTFGPKGVPYNIVRVTGRLDEISVNDGSNPPQVVDRRVSMFFAPVLGHNQIKMQVTSVATFQPRDIMLVLDYSGSMNNDTEFKSIESLGPTAVEEAILTMWHELGDPVYGSLPYDPEYLTVSGVEATELIPLIEATYKGLEVDVIATMDLDTVKIQFRNNNTQTFSNLSGLTGTFAGTGSNLNVQIKRVWVESGANANLSAQGWGEYFGFYNADIATWLGLINYPHPSGSWSDFVKYVNADEDVNTASYRYKYGTMCLINYWNERKPKYSQTPGLSVCSTQPLTAAKNASDALIDYVKEVEADDQLGLAIYTHNSANGAIVETGLTSDLDSVKPFYRDRQAAHYDNMTNIGADIQQARLEIVANARPQAFRMIILMTDGIANRPYGNPKGFALAQAALCHIEKIKIMTISLGLGADQDLMQDIADATGGFHFNVPGGGTIEEYEAQLMTVFQQIAADRPFKLLPSQ